MHPEEEAPATRYPYDEWMRGDGGILGRLTIRRSVLLDSLLAVALAGFVVVASVAIPRQGAERPLDGFAVALLLVASLSVSMRRSAPVIVTAVTIGCALAYYAVPYSGIFADTPAVIAGYTLAAAGRQRLAVAAGAVLVVGLLVLGLLPDRSLGGSSAGAMWILGFWVAFLVAGRITHERAAYLRAVEERAAEAELRREETGRRRASEERLRIARELHDSLTHTISVITVQAGVSAHLAERAPERATEALPIIDAAAREAMQQLRTTLGVLHESPMPDDESDVVPTLADLPSLVARAEACGTPVAWNDATVDVPAHVSAAAFRVVQESLTNVARHAPGAAAEVVVAQTDGEVVVSVANEPAGQPAEPRVGHGLSGMRQRVSELGGRFSSGQTLEGRFVVEAAFPRGGDLAS